MPQMICKRSQRLTLFDAHNIPYSFQLTPTLSKVFNLEFLSILCLKLNDINIRSKIIHLK